MAEKDGCLECRQVSDDDEDEDEQRIPFGGFISLICVVSQLV